ncbi:MAG: TIGR01777 family oxidoreductase [Acidimicrobiales bacterium]
MKVAVTGSSGLIGSALVASLRADGNQVVRIARPSSRSRSSPDDGQTVRWDVDAGAIELAGLEGLDGVVHLAGEGIGDKRWTDEQKARILESRTKGTALLAGALAGLSAKPPVLVSGSAIGYYGDRGDEELTESSGPQPGNFLSDVCVAWEAATAAAADAGIRVAHIRTGLVLAAGGGALGKTLPLFRFGLGGKIGSGQQWWSWISRTDEVDAIRFLLDHDVAGPVNLTGPAPVTNATYTKAVGQVLHRPTFLSVPRFGPKVLLGAELAEQLLFTSARVVPAVLQGAGFPFTHTDVSAALRAELDK